MLAACLPRCLPGDRLRAVRVYAVVSEQMSDEALELFVDRQIEELRGRGAGIIFAMSAVTRLVTFVDLAEEVGDTRQMSFSARHEAVLLDDRRVLLLNDRGWTSSPLIAVQAGEASDRDSTREQKPDIWATTSVEDIEQTARMVVGPDEPSDGFSQEDAEQGHWAYLSDVLRQKGVSVDALDLRRLPHDVVLSGRLLARVGGSARGF